MNKLFQRSIGQSVEGRNITVEANTDLSNPGTPPGGTLLIGGLHGDEKATVALLAMFRDRFLGTGEVMEPVVVLPNANPDGFARETRYNARGVDLNRNCDFQWSAQSVEPSGPFPWSEPESCALRDFILEFEPAKIITLHWALAEIDADGPQSTGLARAMWSAMTESERQPYRIRVAEREQDLAGLYKLEGFCPGSFGQWCGYGLRYRDGARPAMITLELPYDPYAPERPAPLPENHLDELRMRWRNDPAKYLGAVAGGVHRMLTAACRYGG